MNTKIATILSHSAAIGVIQGVSEAPVDEWIKVITSLVVAVAALVNLFKKQKKA